MLFPITFIRRAAMLKKTILSLGVLGFLGSIGSGAIAMEKPDYEKYAQSCSIFDEYLKTDTLTKALNYFNKKMDLVWQSFIIESQDNIRKSMKEREELKKYESSPYTELQCSYIQNSIKGDLDRMRHYIKVSDFNPNF